LEKMARITLKMILQHWLNIEWWHSAAIVLMEANLFLVCISFISSCILKIQIHGTHKLLGFYLVAVTI
jgi:hypothetical protein